MLIAALIFRAWKVRSGVVSLQEEPTAGVVDIFTAAASLVFTLRAVLEVLNHFRHVGGLFAGLLLRQNQFEDNNFVHILGTSRCRRLGELDESAFVLLQLRMLVDELPDVSWNGTVGAKDAHQGDLTALREDVGHLFNRQLVEWQIGCDDSSRWRRFIIQWQWIQATDFRLDIV